MQLDVTIDDVTTATNQIYICKANSFLSRCAIHVRSTRDANFDNKLAPRFVRNYYYRILTKPPGHQPHLIQLLFQKNLSMLLVTMIVKWRVFTILLREILANLILNNLRYSTFTT